MTSVDEKEPGVRERQKLETRNRILQAALELFAEKGFEGASVREIAARAGVIHGLIKYHFDNKDQLWKSAVDFLFERQAEELKPPPGYKELSPYDQARTWIRRYVHYCARHPEHARIMVQESIRDSERLRWAVRKHIGPLHEVARQIGQTRVQDGVYPDIPPHAIIYIISAVSQSPFMLSAEVALAEGKDVSDPAEIDAYADALITFLFDFKAERKGAG